MNYLFSLLALAGIWFVLCQAFNVAFGLGRLFNLAHVGLYAIGAYATALLVVHGAGFWLGAALGVALAAALAAVLGRISLRVSGDYFAVATLALHQIIYSLLLNWTDLTRGPLGIPGIVRPSVFGAPLFSPLSFMLFVWAVALCVGVAFWLFFRSGVARGLQAMGEHEVAATSLGKDPTRLKNIAFVLSAGGAAVAGALMAIHIQFIDPTLFRIESLVLVLAAVVVGGPGSFWGVAAAAVSLTFLPEALRFLELPSSVMGPARQMLYALVLFVVLYARRDVLFPDKREA